MYLFLFYQSLVGMNKSISLISSFTITLPEKPHGAFEGYFLVWWNQNHSNWRPGSTVMLPLTKFSQGKYLC